MNVHTVGIDLGKSVFHVVGLDLRGSIVNQGNSTYRFRSSFCLQRHADSPKLCFMPCSDWRRILENLYQAELAYEEAVSSVSGFEGAEFDHACHAVHDAQRVCQQFERALERHELEHMCLGRAMAAKAS